jgi:hypothetical protein
MYSILFSSRVTSYNKQKMFFLGGDFDLFVLAVDGDCFFEEGILVSIYMVFLNYF